LSGKEESGLLPQMIYVSYVVMIEVGFIASCLADQINEFDVIVIPERKIFLWMCSISRITLNYPAGG